jgi:hypothetical protein
VGTFLSQQSSRAFGDEELNVQLDRFMDGMLRDAEDFAAKASPSADAESPKRSLRVQLHGEGRILERDIDAKYFSCSI